MSDNHAVKYTSVLNSTKALDINVSIDSVSELPFSLTVQPEQRMGFHEFQHQHAPLPMMLSDDVIITGKHLMNATHTVCDSKHALCMSNSNSPISTIP